MKSRLYQYLFLLSILLTSVTESFAQGIKFLYDVPLETVLSQARAQNKLIFIDGYTTYCAPCKQLDRETFPLKQAGNYFNSNFINVKYDLDKPEGKKLLARYKDVITGFPSLILLDQNGNMIHKTGGFQPADTLIARMKAALNGDNLSNIRKRMQAGEKSLAFVRNYKRLLDEGYMVYESERVDLEILNRLTDEEMLNAPMWALIGHSVIDPYSPQFARVVKNYWNLGMQRVTDMGFLEHQLREAIRIAADDILKPVDTTGKLVLKPMPEKEAVLLGYLKDPDKFKHSEALKAQFEVHDLALKGNWAELTTAIKFYNQIGALGSSSKITYPYIQYMMQFCKSKVVLAQAAAILAALPSQKVDVMAYNDNYSTIIKLYERIGNKEAADKYRTLQKSKS